MDNHLILCMVKLNSALVFNHCAFEEIIILQYDVLFLRCTFIFIFSFVKNYLGGQIIAWLLMVFVQIGLCMSVLCFPFFDWWFYLSSDRWPDNEPEFNIIQQIFVAWEWDFLFLSIIPVDLYWCVSHLSDRPINSIEGANEWNLWCRYRRYFDLYLSRINDYQIHSFITCGSLISWRKAQSRNNNCL